MKGEKNMRAPNGFGSISKLSGNRRKPYQVKKTVGWKLNEETGKAVQERIVIGYAKMTFNDVFESWSKGKYPTISTSNIHGYNASYKACTSLYHKVFKDIKLADLQGVIDSSNKNYAEYVDVIRYKDRNPNKYDRERFLLLIRYYHFINNGMIPVLNVSTFSIQKMVNTSYTAITTIAIL